jgi:glucosamine--fructose-6-phosphate aminotransferase (isomerizing)
MCGIFGYLTGQGQPIGKKALDTALTKLFVLSEARGKEAAGLAIANSASLQVLKLPIPGTRLVRHPYYHRLLEKAIPNAAGNVIAAIGHSRLVTDGCQGLHINNQPVHRDNMVVVHNGIVVNAASLWAAHPDLDCQSGVDTEIIPALLAEYRRHGMSLVQACQALFADIEGETSIAILFTDENQLLLASNTGSLFVARQGERALCFASEAYIIQQILKDASVPAFDPSAETFQVKARTAMLINLDNLRQETFFLTEAKLETNGVPLQVAAKLAEHRRLEDYIAEVEQAKTTIKRCTRCILPESMPFIHFDESGVCNFCRLYQPDTLLPETELEEILARHRRKDGQADCLVAFSGGRDSCYGLHLLKEKFGMNPIAYTYDWGMVTSLGRRNQARVCGKLGVEHIWVSADIRAKRDNIRRNVEAWMKKPDLGIIPLFMAGDKQFFYYANQIIRQTSIPLMIFCSNKLEKTDFKVGFCGIPPYTKDPTQPHNLGKSGKFGLLGYYMRQYLKNPAYINRSIPDTIGAYASYYMIKKDFTYLFDYCDWNEDQINELLLNEYNWELAPDTNTTWRIGDGTAPFYNYIYHTVAGFTEHDTFRSNQIREGILSREKALALTLEENQPRWQSLREYAQLIRIDFDEFLRVVHAMPKQYPHE